MARKLRPKATTEDFLATSRHGAALGDTIRATQVSDWLGGGSGWRVATAYSHIDSWADECIDMTPSADSYTDELLFGDRVN